jgi:hypothetical protein
MGFETYKTIVDAEVDAFNKICKDISKEIETNSKIIEEHHQALKHRIDIDVENKRLLRNHMFAKYNIGFVDINVLIVKFRYRTKYTEEYFQDKYVLEKLEAISNFNIKCNEIDKLKVKNSQLKIILAKVNYLTPEHFVYSSLEALKNVIKPEVTYSSLESYSNRAPHSLYINNIYAFPHNTETDVSYIDEKLVDLFEDIFRLEIVRTYTPCLGQRRYITSVHKLF